MFRDSDWVKHTSQRPHEEQNLVWKERHNFLSWQKGLLELTLQAGDPHGVTNASFPSKEEIASATPPAPTLHKPFLKKKEA